MGFDVKKIVETSEDGNKRAISNCNLKMKARMGFRDDVRRTNFYVPSNFTDLLTLGIILYCKILRTFFY